MPKDRIEMDAQKLKAITLYICARLREHAQHLTVARLHQILWHADGQTYVRLGRAIVGEDYVREVEGPKALHLGPALDELKREGRLDIQPTKPNNQLGQVLITHDAPDIAFLSAYERKILDEVIERVARDPQQLPEGPLWEVRDSGERYAGHLTTWKAAAIGERIAYQQQLLEQLPSLTKEDAEWVAAELRDRR